MKKEVLIAIILGCLVGVFLGFGFYKANRAVKQKVQTAVSQPTETPSKNHLTESIEGQEAKLTLTFPYQNMVLFSDSATLSGETSPNTPVAVLTEEDEYIIASDQTGNFSQPINLIKGINEITVSAVFNLEKVMEEKLYLIYTTDEIEES